MRGQDLLAHGSIERQSRHRWCACVPIGPVPPTQDRRRLSRSVYVAGYLAFKAAAIVCAYARPPGPVRCVPSNTKYSRCPSDAAAQSASRTFGKSLRHIADAGVGFFHPLVGHVCSHEDDPSSVRQVLHCRAQVLLIRRTIGSNVQHHNLRQLLPAAIRDPSTADRWAEPVD